MPSTALTHSQIAADLLVSHDSHAAAFQGLDGRGHPGNADTVYELLACAADTGCGVKLSMLDDEGRLLYLGGTVETAEAYYRAAYLVEGVTIVPEQVAAIRLDFAAVLQPNH